MSRDVTIGRKEDENAFGKGEERYRRLVESSFETISVINEEGRIVFINDAGARLASVVDREELVGKFYLDFVHPDF